VTTDKGLTHGEWAGKFTFFLAVTGSTVGLGNLWKFPYVAGSSGGGSFILIYLLCLFLIGLPLMMAEIMLGRLGRQSPVNSLRRLAKIHGLSGLWKWLGVLGMLIACLILSYYSVIGGWAFAYTVRAASGLFTGQTMDGVVSLFSRFAADPEHLLAWHTLFMLTTVMVVSRGVKNGLELTVKWLMPVLVIILIVLVVYAVRNADVYNAFAFLFHPDFSKITPDIVLTAMGHAFFTLSLGMGAIMVYGSYIGTRAPICGLSTAIIITDTLVAILAGLAIFPLVFSFQLEGVMIQSDPGLLFRIFPYVFGQMPAGTLMGTLFFILLSIAALTSAISLLEPAVAWLVESRGMTRPRASAWAGFLVWLLGLASMLSFTGLSLRDMITAVSVWLGYYDPGLEHRFYDLSFFAMIDYLTAKFLLPVSGILIAIFSGWMLKEEVTRQELSLSNGSYKCWSVLVRYVAPIAIFIVLLNATGALVWIGRFINH